MRLAFCCLMISNNTPDLFILDEPTNNLDIHSIEIITATIRNYTGSVLLVSHDEYFIKETGMKESIFYNLYRLKRIIQNDTYKKQPMVHLLPRSVITGKEKQRFLHPFRRKRTHRHTGRNNRTHPNYARWHIRQKFLHRFSDHRNTGICTNGVARFL